jgi:hypothetical protein
MEYHFSAVAKRTYLHVIGSGTNSVDNLRRLFVDTDRVRREKQLDAVLVEMRFLGPSLNLGDIYSIMLDNRADASRLKRIAFADTNTEHLPERGEFIELASSKLGVNCRVFRSVAAAEEWLGE